MPTERLCLAAVVLSVFACASNPGVVRLGPDRLLVTRQAASGFTGMGALEAKAVQEATAYCSTQSKTAQVLATRESEPPYVFGNFPRVEVEFTCVASEATP